MIADAFAAFEDMFSPASRAALWKSVGATLALLALLWAALDVFIVGHIVIAAPWLATLLSILTGVGLFVALAFLVGPVSSLVAGFFLDDLCEAAERGMGLPPGRPCPVGEALWLGIRFALAALVVNGIALLLLLAPGLNLIAFFGANAYLAGRAYFEFAALRYRPLGQALALRRAHSAYLFGCGLVIAAFMAAPLLNLLTPLFATAFMARVHARIAPPPSLPAA